MPEADITGGLRWATEPSRAATRGHRIIAWVVAVQGTSVIDGATDLPEVARRRAIPVSTFYDHLKALRTKFGLTPPGVELLGVTEAIRNDFS